MYRLQGKQQARDFENAHAKLVYEEYFESSQNA